MSSRIAKIVREEIVRNGAYHEPFVGAGSVLFELSDINNLKYASDIVEPLIETYKLIQQNPIGIWSELQTLRKSGLDKQEYSLRRTAFNHGQMGLEKRAAHFIYLNHACYNGLWRTNKKGEFNVPFGDHKNLNLPDQGDFIRANQALYEVHFDLIEHPRAILDSLEKRVKAGDVVFSDPPYFHTYDDYDEFDYDMGHFHEELACILWHLHLHGATVIAMNSMCDETLKWYGAFCNVEIIERHQGVAGTNEGRGEWRQILAIAR